MRTMMDLEIGGMGCDHCVAGVRTALEAIPGVQVETVTVGSARVLMEEATGADRGALEEAVRKAGFEPKGVREVDPRAP